MNNNDDSSQHEIAVNRLVATQTNKQTRTNASVIDDVVVSGGIDNKLMFISL